MTARFSAAVLLILLLINGAARGRAVQWQPAAGPLRTKWAADVGMSTRVLFLLAAEGAIVRARPRGSWISGQYRWAPLDAWLGEGPAAPSQPVASAELLGRFIGCFGPATEKDIRWWMGWTKRQMTAALVQLEVV